VVEGGRMNKRIEIPESTFREIDRSRLKLEEVLGEGAFGEVWKGSLHPKAAKSKNGDIVRSFYYF